MLVEVIEHLDPEPLAALGPAVFGRLRPPLVVVTTPNRGLNGVMAASGVRLLHNGLRNRDHRFEWCDCRGCQAVLAFHRASILGYGLPCGLVLHTCHECLPARHAYIGICMQMGLHVLQDT